MRPFGELRVVAFLVTKRIFILFLALSDIVFTDVLSNTADVDRLINEGTRLLASGQIAEALVKYNMVIDQDDSNYLSYFRRATVYLALGKSKSALADLDKVLDMNKDFDSAREKRIDINYKSGEFSKAEEDVNYLISKGVSIPANEALLLDLKKYSEKLELTKRFYQTRYYQEALSNSVDLVEHMPFLKEIREIRADCYMKLGDKQKAIHEYRHMVKLSTDNRLGILQLSRLIYEVGDAEHSLNEIRECLRLDPDHKECFQHYKVVKKLAKKLTSLTEAASKQDEHVKCTKLANEILKDHGQHSSYVDMMNTYLCRCQIQNDPEKAVERCTKAISVAMDGDINDLYCDRADAYVNLEDYDSAISDYQQVLGKDRRHSRASKGLQKAQKLLKRSKQRDYYKILDVPRTASKQQIMRAYRKLAAIWHPDRHDAESKAAAEVKFVEISAAKEVLSNPEMRQKYDNGEDPLDPEHQQQGGSQGGPFGGFTFTNFNPFEGGHFEFHFG